MKKAKAFIFDMDGVITDTQSIIASVESDLLKEYGIDISPEIITEKYAGTTSREMLPHIFNAHGKEVIDLGALMLQRTERIDDAVKGKVKAIPGTIEFIHKLKAVETPIAVASGSRTHFIKNVLSELEILHAFNSIAGSDEVLRGKPAPDVFLLAAEKLGVLPEDCIVIEDGINGMIGAKAAGMRCIALSINGGKDYPADMVVKNLLDVDLSFLD